MYEGNPVDLRMEKIISADGIFDEATRQCRVEKYDPEEDYIYLELKEDELTVFHSMLNTDVIFDKDRTFVLHRGVKERYCRDDRKFLKLRIENGFYNVYEGRKMTKRA